MQALNDAQLLYFGQRWWKPKSGPKRRFSSIDLVWLCNIREFLVGVHERARLEMEAAYSYSGGEMAEYFAEQAGDAAAQHAYNAEALSRLLDQYIAWRAEHETVLPGRWR